MLGINPMGLSVTWDDSYPNSCYEPPTFRYQTFSSKNVSPWLYTFPYKKTLDNNITLKYVLSDDDVYKSIYLFETIINVEWLKKMWGIHTMDISYPWEDSYTKNSFEAPNCHHHWWCFGINGSSTTKTTLDRNQQEKLETIALNPVNQLIMTSVTTKPATLPQPSTILWGGANRYVRFLYSPHPIYNHT